MSYLLAILLTALPLCFSQVTVSPSGTFISHVYGEANLICSSRKSGVAEVNWIVTLHNDTILDYEGRQNITAEFAAIGNGVGSLHFTYLLADYNMSHIVCEIRYRDGSIIRSVEATMLLLQGILGPVGSLKSVLINSTFHVTWTPPFALIDDEESGYTIDVLNSTADVTVFSDFINFNETEFFFDQPEGSWCDTFVFTVTPVNSVGNGPSIATPHYYDQARVFEVLCSPNSSNSFFRCSLMMSAGVCDAKVVFVDDFTNEIITISGANLTIMDRNISFTTDKLKTNRHYSANITAKNNYNSTTSEFSLNTHEIEAAMVTDTDLSVVYSDGSTASGALFSFVFITDSGNVDFTRSALLALDRNTSHNYTLPFNLYPGNYTVYVYDIENDGVLSSGVGYPAVTQDLVITESGEGQAISSCSLVEDCSVRVLLDTINVSCPHNSGFQVVVHSNISDGQKIYANKSSSLNTVTVAVEESGTYEISIFPRLGIFDLTNCTKQVLMDVMISVTTKTDSTDPTNMSTSPTNMGNAAEDSFNPIYIFIIVAVFLVIVILAVTIAVILIARKRSRSNHQATGNITETMGTYHSTENGLQTTPQTLPLEEQDSPLQSTKTLEQSGQQLETSFTQPVRTSLQPAKSSLQPEKASLQASRISLQLSYPPESSLSQNHLPERSLQKTRSMESSLQSYPPERSLQPPKPTQQRSQLLESSLQSPETSLQQGKTSLQQAKTSLQPSHPPESSLQPQETSLQAVKTSMQPVKTSLQQNHTPESSLQPPETFLPPLETSLQLHETSLKADALLAAKIAVQPAKTSLQRINTPESSLQPTATSLQSATTSLQTAKASLQRSHPPDSSLQPAKMVNPYYTGNMDVNASVRTENADEHRRFRKSISRSKSSLNSSFASLHYDLESGEGGAFEAKKNDRTGCSVM